MASLKLEHIYKVYPNGAKAVNDISLDIENGEFIVFVGPSGCGKSTTLRMIAGLEEITAGELYIGPMIVNDVEPKDRDIAMVFQNYALYPHMTVYENMAFGLKLRHIPDDIIQEKVLWAADILGLKEYLDRKPRAMSGGQRQRVALGRAILRDPKVMLLDEPLSNLDAKLRTQMRTEIAKLHKKLQTTFIYVTHDQTEAMTLGDRVVVMKAGRIMQVDSPKNLYEHPNNIFVAGFIGSPQMNFFDCTLKREGDKVVVHFLEADSTISLPYADLIKVDPNFLDGEKQIVMGVRCEHCHISEEGELAVTISHFEELGSESLVYGSIGEGDEVTSSKGQMIIKSFDTSGLQTGDKVKVKLDLDHIYFFDKESENTIVPQIPSYNSFESEIKDGKVKFVDEYLELPEACKVSGEHKGELVIDSDAFIADENGAIECDVVKREDIGGQHLVHLRKGDRTFFYLSSEEVETDKIRIDIDYSKISFVTTKGEKLISPLRTHDDFKSYFYNYRTVVDRNPREDFVSFHDEKIQTAVDFMDAKIAIEQKNYDTQMASAQAVSEEEKNKILEDFNSLKYTNETKIKNIKEETKRQIYDLTSAFKEDKKSAKVENDKIFLAKKESEEKEYREFLENNTDKDAIKRRKDEYHIFKDNYATDRDNALNLKINFLTMDYESKVSTLKASSRRECDLLKKEIKEARNNCARQIDPVKYIEKEHKIKQAELEYEKKKAVDRAGLLFFFNIASDYYLMSTDIISNKLVQGLGTRVFSKEFVISMPHDAYKIVEKDGLDVTVEDNLDYGRTYYVKLSYSDAGTKKEIYLKSDKRIEKGTKLSLAFDITKSMIIETGMNIRLY